MGGREKYLQEPDVNSSLATRGCLERQVQTAISPELDRRQSWGRDKYLLEPDINSGLATKGCLERQAQTAIGPELDRRQSWGRGTPAGAGHHSGLATRRAFGVRFGYAWGNPATIQRLSLPLVGTSCRQLLLSSEPDGIVPLEYFLFCLVPQLTPLLDLARPVIQTHLTQLFEESAGRARWGPVVVVSRALLSCDGLKRPRCRHVNDRRIVLENR